MIVTDICFKLFYREVSLNILWFKLSLYLRYGQICYHSFICELFCILFMSCKGIWKRVLLCKGPIYALI